MARAVCADAAVTAVALADPFVAAVAALVPRVTFLMAVFFFVAAFFGGAFFAAVLFAGVAFFVDVRFAGALFVDALVVDALVVVVFFVVVFFAAAFAAARFGAVFFTAADLFVGAAFDAALAVVFAAALLADAFFVAALAAVLFFVAVLRDELALVALVGLADLARLELAAFLAVLRFAAVEVLEVDFAVLAVTVPVRDVEAADTARGTPSSSDSPCGLAPLRGRTARPIGCTAAISVAHPSIDHAHPPGLAYRVNRVGRSGCTSGDSKFGP